MLDERKRLDGLAEPHFVRKDAAEPVFTQEVEVRDPLQLIVAQRGPHASGLIDGHHFPEVVDFFAQRIPERVGFHVGQVVKEVVQHGGFKLLELTFGRLGRIKAQRLQLVSQFLQPGFRQACVGAVLQLDITAPLGPRLPNFLQGQLLAVVFHGDVEREPLFFFVAFELGRNDRLGNAHLVAGQRLFAVHTPVFHQLGVGIEQKGDGLFRFHKPQLVTARLKAHFGKLRHQVGFFRLVAAREERLALEHIAACLEIGVWPGHDEFAVNGLVGVLHLKRQKAPLFSQKQLGIVGGRLENGLHDAQKLFGLIEFGGGQARPDPIEEFGNIVLRHNGAVGNELFDQRRRKARLHRIEALVPADPHGHLPMERDFTLVVGDAERRLAGALQIDVKMQAVVVERRPELERHGRGHDGAGDVRIFPEQIIFPAHGPEKPGHKPLGNFHPVAVVVQKMPDLADNADKLRRMFAPFGVAQNLLKRRFLMNR